MVGFKQIDNTDDFVSYHFKLICQTTDFLQHGTLKDIPNTEPKYEFKNEICFHKDSVLCSKVYHNKNIYNYHCFAMNLYRPFHINDKLNENIIH